MGLFINWPKEEEEGSSLLAFTAQRLFCGKGKFWKHVLYSTVQYSTSWLGKAGILQFCSGTDRTAHKAVKLWKEEEEGGHQLTF